MKTIRFGNAPTALKRGRWSGCLRIGAFALLLVVLTSSSAFAAANFFRTITFGDSLTRNEVLFIDSGEPSELYGADPMEAAFRKSPIPGKKLRNFAVPGQQAGNLDLQITAYEAQVRTGLIGRGSLFLIEVGGNDILDALPLLRANPPFQNAAADNRIMEIVRQIRSDLFTLRDDHPRAQFVLWTIPDVTLTPRLFGRMADRGRANVQAHISRANRAILSLDALPRVAVVDIYALTQQMALNPPVIFGTQLVPPPAMGSFTDLFADPLHPTAVSNALIANAILAKVNADFRDTLPLYNDRQLARLARMPIR